jgi:hypothetical protein
MRHLIILIVHLITTILRVAQPGTVCAPSSQNPFSPNIN